MRSVGQERRLTWRTLVVTSCVASCVAGGRRPVEGQSLDISGYALGVAAHAEPSEATPEGTSLLGRVRMMSVLTIGSLDADLAYEHLLRRAPAGGGLAVTRPGSGEAADWLGLDWQLGSTARSEWRHRFDRLSVGFDAGSVSVTVGRQAISWATTLLLTPNDPFSPFDPSDPFREYRGGVDALRAELFPGPFSEVDLVVRGAEAPGGSTVTALARGQTSLGGWAVGVWGGVVHDDVAASAFGSGAVAATGVTASLSVRRKADGGATLRSALGAERRFTVFGRDLYAVTEVQYDGYGATRAEELGAVTASAPFARGEMQTLGRWSGATQWSYQAHPLVSLDILALVNLQDGSALLAPGASWSVTGSTTVRAGLFDGSGASAVDPLRGPSSEYGTVPLVAYVAVSSFF